mmetsp:Transcript_18199/g.41187  ORF Transcript_18199/g.41187 Transcript_18199/m.41187 type:complete len:184 (-) Transcript_18199:44-595(-)
MAPLTPAAGCCCCGLQLGVQIVGELDIICGLYDLYIAVCGFMNPNRFHPAPWARGLCGFLTLLLGGLTVRGALAAKTRSLGTVDDRKVALVGRAVLAQWGILVAAASEHVIMLVLLLRWLSSWGPDFLVEYLVVGLFASLLFIVTFNAWGIYAAWSLREEFKAGGPSVLRSGAMVVGKPVPSE